MVKRTLLLLVLSTLILLAACRDAAPGGQSEAPQTTEGFVSYESESMGLRLQHPENWVTHRAFNGLTVASSQEVVNGSSLAQIGDGAFVNIIPGELAVFNAQTGENFSSEQPQQVLERYRALLESQGQIYTVVEPPEVSNVDGRNMATMVVSSVVEGETLVTILGSHLSGEYVALSSAGALQDHFEEARPTLEQIVSTIEPIAPIPVSEQ